MLGRLVSDTWTSSASADEQDEPVFIDRDGDTFGLLLHYLRYGTVSLPLTVPRDNFLRDLDFYGIVAMEGTIDCASSSLQAAQHMALCEREYSHKLKEFDAKIRELEMRKSFTIIAHECFLRHSKDGSMTFQFRSKTNKQSPEHKMFEIALETFSSKRIDTELFNEYLSEYGFTTAEQKRYVSLSPALYVEEVKLNLKFKAAGSC